MDTFPDLGSLTDQELKDLIAQLTDEEMEISYKRRILHGKIDILRAELVARLQKTEGRSVLDQVDVDAANGWEGVDVDRKHHTYCDQRHFGLLADAPPHDGERDEGEDHDRVHRLDLRREPCDAHEMQVHFFRLQHPLAAALVP